MRDHFKKDTVEIAERFKFFKRMQQNNEGVAEYLAELRKLGKTCNFGNYLEKALRDQLVCGLKDHATRKDLLCTKELSLTLAVEKAGAAEAVNREVLHFSLKTEAETLKLYDQQKPCHRCGQFGHTGATCIHKSKHCHICKKLGHLSSVCWHNQQLQPIQQKSRRTTNQLKSTHAMQATIDSNSDEEDFDTNQLHIHKTSKRHTEKLTTVLAVGGVNVEVKVDTGAEVSTMPMALYQQKFNHVPICPSTVRLHQYDGSVLPTKGEIVVEVCTNQQRLTGKFVIVDIVNEQLPLLGRDWLYHLKLDWPKLLGHTSIHMLDSITLKKEFPDVFKEELGLLQGIEAVIDLKEGSKPRFCKSRPIPFALREQVEQAIHKQVADGELEPVDRSDWAAPIVVVTKKDGGIRICADFKMTINPHLCMQTFPLPTPDEVFSTLVNGESFTKLDLSRAYKQVKVATNSQCYLTINTHLGLYRYLRLPFGIASAPAIWQRAMTTVLQG